jgi:calcineurin-like phosphoesterase family protein
MIQKYFFTSDLHLSHRNIIKYCNRPFADASQMNEEIILRWNSTVQPHDKVFIVGDVSFEKDREKTTRMLRRLNGSKHVVWGNHDKEMKHAIIEAGCHDCGDLHSITVPPESNRGVSQRIVLCHYAMRVWDQSHRGVWHLFGHSHGTMPDDQYSLSCDVGVDAWDFYPVSMEQLNKLMKNKKWKPIDHHGDRL